MAEIYFLYFIMIHAGEKYIFKKTSLMKWSVFWGTHLQWNLKSTMCRYFIKWNACMQTWAFCFLKCFAFLFFIFLVWYPLGTFWVSQWKNVKKKAALVFILLPLEPGHCRNNCPSGWDGYFQCCLDIPDTNMYTGWISISDRISDIYIYLCITVI